MGLVFLKLALFFQFGLIFCFYRNDVLYAVEIQGLFDTIHRSIIYPCTHCNSYSHAGTHTETYSGTYTGTYTYTQTYGDPYAYPRTDPYSLCGGADYV